MLSIGHHWQNMNVSRAATSPETVYTREDAVRGDPLRRRILESNHEVTLAVFGGVAI